MKRIVILALALIILLLSACAIGKRGLSEEDKLLSELKKWDNFEGSGVVEISAMGLALRKPFVLSKNTSEIRLDLIEGGVLGASAAPLLSVYLGEYTAIKAPIMPVLETLDLSGMLPAGGLSKYANSQGIFDKYKDEIIAEKAIQREELKITFDKSYRLTELLDRRSNATLKAAYTPKGNIDILTLTRGKSISLKFIFDSVEYTNPSIVALPKQEQPSSDIMKMLENNPMLKMFKGIMGE